MTNEMMKVNEVEITNTKLRNFTEQIHKQGQNIQKSFAKVAAILTKIDDSKCYEQDGFESVHDYTNKVFGWKKANSYAMLKVGREYIDGKTLESVLPHETGNDYSTSQLQALLPLKSVDTVKELAEREEISPAMSVREIKEVVKAYKNKDEIVDVEGEESETADTPETLEAVAYTVINSIELVSDADGKNYILCDGEKVSKELIIDLISTF